MSEENQLENAQENQQKNEGCNLHLFQREKLHTSFKRVAYQVEAQMIQSS